MKPFSISQNSSKTLIIGARQFVVQDPFEIIISPLYSFTLTPGRYTGVSSFGGADMITFFAPASICACAFSVVRNTPVHSKTTSTSNSVSYTHLRAHETVLDLVCRL